MTKEQLKKKAIEVLNPKELILFQMMFGQYLVPFLLGKPGTAKSALAESIANKLGMVYIDLRLPTMDEVNLGVYPVVDHRKEYSVVRSAVPDWAEMTNDKTKFYLICLEELNRASLSVRNAALGILNERRVGHNFRFTDNVFMLATGNMGAEDGTDVEEFDVALKSRLKTVYHDMDLADWIEDYAKDNVHRDIVGYLKDYPSHYYPALKENEQNRVITCPRTWDALSKDIIAWFGKNSTVEQYGTFLKMAGKNYVGSHAMQLFQWASEMKKYTLKDVLEDKINYNKIQRENKAEILQEVLATDIPKLKIAETALVIKFMRECDRDALVGSLYDIFTKWQQDEQDLSNKNAKIMVKEFEKEIEYINANYQTFEDKVQEPEQSK